VIAAASVLVASSVASEAEAAACPSVNRPNMLKIVAGSPQTAKLGDRLGGLIHE
jgi:hypothetical protein